MSDELELRDEVKAPAKTEAKAAKPVAKVAEAAPAATLEVPAPVGGSMEALMSRHNIEASALRLLGLYAQQGVMEHAKRMERLIKEQPTLAAAYQKLYA